MRRGQILLPRGGSSAAHLADVLFEEVLRNALLATWAA
jgi:hypothetical protein